MVCLINVQASHSKVRIVLLYSLRNCVDLVIVPRQGDTGRAVLTGHDQSIYQVRRDGILTQRNGEHATRTAHLLGHEPAHVAADDGLLQGQGARGIRSRHLAAGVSHDGSGLDAP